MAGCYLIEREHRSVAVIGAGDNIRSGAARFSGFACAFTELPAGSLSVIRRIVGYTISDGRRLCAEPSVPTPWLRWPRAE